MCLLPALHGQRPDLEGGRLSVGHVGADAARSPASRRGDIRGRCLRCLAREGPGGYERSLPAVPRWRRNLAAGRLPGGAPGASAHAAIAASGERVHVVFGDSREGQAEIAYTRSTNAGETWEPQRRLTELPYDSWVPSLAADGDNVVLAWVDTGDGNEEEYVRVSRDGGATWAMPTRLTENAANSWAPSVAVNGGVIHLAWFDQKSAPFRPIEVEATLDEVMKTLGLPVEPVPQGIRVPNVEEVAKRRATEKMMQIQAAMDAWVQGGGDAEKLQQIMRELHEMARPTGLVEADARLNEALRLIGVDPRNEEPPDDERLWPQRIQAKMRRIQEEGPKWVQAGGDERKLRAILEAFETQMRGAAPRLTARRSGRSTRPCGSWV